MVVENVKHHDTKLLLKLTIPIFFELILQVLLGNVDKIMVGNENLANAITQANTIIDMLTVSISVLSAGSLILINQYKGAQNLIKEKSIYSVAFFFNLLLSITLGLILVIFGKPILVLMKVNSTYFNETLLYLRLCGGFLFFQGIILTFSSFLRSNTFVVQGFIVSISINILNVALNALFLYVLKLPGILSVALGTLISRFVGVIILLILIIKLAKIKLSVKDAIKNSKTELKKLLKLSIPSAGESISYSLSQIVILTIINIIDEKINPGAATAKSFVNIMVQFSFIFTSSITQAMQIILGRHLGAKEITKAEKLITKTLIISIVSSIIIAIIQAVLSRPIFSLFISNYDIVTLCVKIMFIEILLEIGRAINITFVRALQTSGDVMFPTVLAVIFCWGVAVVGSYVFGISLALGIIGVWIAMTIDELCRGAIFIVRFKKGKWKKYNLVEKTN